MSSKLSGSGIGALYNWVRLVLVLDNDDRCNEYELHPINKHTNVKGNKNPIIISAPCWYFENDLPKLGCLYEWLMVNVQVVDRWSRRMTSCMLTLHLVGSVTLWVLVAFEISQSLLMNCDVCDVLYGVFYPLSPSLMDERTLYSTQYCTQPEIPYSTYRRPKCGFRIHPSVSHHHVMASALLCLWREV